MKSDFNLPPGCRACDIPGNGPDQAQAENDPHSRFCEECGALFLPEAANEELCWPCQLAVNKPLDDKR